MFKKGHNNFIDKKTGKTQASTMYFEHVYMFCKNKSN